MSDRKTTEVISLSKKKKEFEEAAAGFSDNPKVVDRKEVVETDFEAEMKANEAKKKKAAEERLKANKSVLRNYRIKN